MAPKNMKTSALAILLTAVMAFGVSPAAQSPRDSLIVSPAWLAAHLKDANLVLLHVGDKADYDARESSKKQKTDPGGNTMDTGDS